MGIIVQDPLELDNGVVTNNYYIRVREIDIINNTNNRGVYQIVGICDFYANVEARKLEKNTLKHEYISIGSESLDNVHEQIYNNLKSKYTSYNDDFSDFNVEGSNQEIPGESNQEIPGESNLK